jgi:predicted MFS family arabinose efflux permease
LGWNTDCQHSFHHFGEMFISLSIQFFAFRDKGHEGRYMALFTMSFSLAHIASSKTGLTIIDAYGYQANWFVMGSLGILSVKLHLAAKLVQKTIPIVILWGLAGRGK